MLIIIEMLLRSGTPHHPIHRRVVSYTIIKVSIYLFITIFMEIYVPNRGEAEED